MTPGGRLLQRPHPRPHPRPRPRNALANANVSAITIVAEHATLIIRHRDSRRELRILGYATAHKVECLGAMANLIG